jgi:hypothetical protein
MRKRPLLLSITAAGIAGAAAFGWVTMRRCFSARDTPSVVETYVAKTARTLFGPGVTTQRDESFPAHPRSSQRGARPLRRSLRQLPRQRRQREDTDRPESLPENAGYALTRDAGSHRWEIYYIIHNGVRLTGMPAWGGPGKDDDR